MLHVVLAATAVSCRPHVQKRRSYRSSSLHRGVRREAENVSCAVQALGTLLFLRLFSVQYCVRPPYHDEHLSCLPGDATDENRGKRICPSFKSHEERNKRGMAHSKSPTCSESLIMHRSRFFQWENGGLVVKPSVQIWRQILAVDTEKRLLGDITLGLILRRRMSSHATQTSQLVCIVC